MTEYILCLSMLLNLGLIVVVAKSLNNINNLKNKTL